MKKWYMYCVELRARYIINNLDKISRPARSCPFLLKPPLHDALYNFQVFGPNGCGPVVTQDGP